MATVEDYPLPSEWIRRKGKSTNRITQGQIYRIVGVNGRWRIRCDASDCDYMEPTLPIRGAMANSYWEFVMDDDMDAHAYAMHIAKTHLNTLEDKPMADITIKQATLINGVDADNISVQSFLDMIKAQGEVIDKMIETGATDSKVVRGQMDKCSANIDSLIKIMDQVHGDS